MSAPQLRQSKCIGEPAQRRLLSTRSRVLFSSRLVASATRAAFFPRVVARAICLIPFEEHETKIPLSWYLSIPCCGGWAPTSKLRKTKRGRYCVLPELEERRRRTWLRGYYSNTRFNFMKSWV